MIIYLASPYSHADAEVRRARFEQICQVAARLMAQGVHVFSPIAHTHPVALAGDLPKHWEFWEEYDRKFIAICAELWICMMDGWEESRGIAAELRIAAELGLPVRYVAP